MIVYGTLKATGVTFTWTDGLNQWTGIKFTGSGSSNSRLENCIIEHASGLFGGLVYDLGIINIIGSSPTITGCTIGSSSAANGFLIRNSSPVISNNIISGMQNSGIYLNSYNQYYPYTANQSFPTVTGNIISSSQNGIDINETSGGTYQKNNFSGSTSYGISYSGFTILDARNNNWGDPSGPLDDSDDRTSGGWYNPNGKGGRVSDRVMYDPWLGKPLTVTLTVQGGGKGTVTSDPAGIATNVSTISTAFGYGDNLHLTAKADEYHLFSGWSGGCTTKTGDCAMTLTGDFAVTASFDKDTVHAVRLNRPTPVYYPTLLEAYTNAVNGDTIQAWAVTYEETLTLNGNKRVTFSGGYDQGYTTVKGRTGLKGKLTLGNGVSVLENIVVR